MRKFLLLTVLLVSCASNEIRKPLEDQITTDMGIFNQRILGYLYRNEMKKDVSRLNRDIYLNLVSEKHEPSEQEYVEFLEIKDIEVEVKSTKNNFIVCAKSVLYKIILCDKASTAIVDFVSRDATLQVNETIQNLAD